VFCELLSNNWLSLDHFLFIFFGSKNTVIVIAKYYMIERSSTVLLTDAVEPDASEVISEAISEAWFYVAT